uniref:Uncharacterized protein n=1 Tax=Neobodo designis TaxID=312471 RepID=A0A7S1KXX9_NEODS
MGRVAIVVCGAATIATQVGSFEELERAVAEAFPSLRQQQWGLACDFDGVTLTVMNAHTLLALLRLIDAEDPLELHVVLHATNAVNENDRQNAAELSHPTTAIAPQVLAYVENSDGSWSDGFRVSLAPTFFAFRRNLCNSKPYARAGIVASQPAISFSLTDEPNREIDLDGDDDVRLLRDAVAKFGTRSVRVRISRPVQPSKALAARPSHRPQNSQPVTVELD